MPKRKRDSDLDLISDQIKKLKKELKRARRRKQSTSSSSSETSSKINLEDNVPSEIWEEHLPSEEEPNVEIVSAEPISELPSEPPPSIPDVEQVPNEINNQTDDMILDKDILDILGDNPENKVQHGPDIHKELASRLQYITTSGLTKETRKELQQKYLLPSNGTLLGAPMINPEIKATLPETLVNRDKALESKQKLLGSAISCLATATSSLLGAQHKDTELLKKLMDACKLLCDIQHSDSVTRRMFSMSALKKEVKTQIMPSKIDKFLFGENLHDALKTAKAVSKSSAEIKNSYNNNKNRKNPQPSTSKASNLNAKGPAAPFRRPPVPSQKTRQAASHQSQPAKQYKTSSQPQKNVNNHHRT